MNPEKRKQVIYMLKRGEPYTVIAHCIKGVSYKKVQQIAKDEEIEKRYGNFIPRL